jgi:hypothetical protein
VMEEAGIVGRETVVAVVAFAFDNAETAAADLGTAEPVVAAEPVPELVSELVADLERAVELVRESVGRPGVVRVDKAVVEPVNMSVVVFVGEIAGPVDEAAAVLVAAFVAAAPAAVVLVVARTSLV